MRGVLLAALCLAALSAVGSSCSTFKNEGTDAATDASTDAGALDGSQVDAVADGGAPDAAKAVDAGDAASAADGGVCTQSRCPTTTVLAGLYGPAALAVDATYVYWLEVGTMIPQAGGEGQLVRLQKGTSCADRSCVEVIDPYALSGTFEGQLIYDNQLALGPSDVCYSQSFNAQAEHQISCFTLASLAQVVVDQDYGDCDALWIGPGSPVWSLGSTTDTSSDGAIRSRAIEGTDGGAAAAIAGSRPYPTSVLADGSGTVWSELGAGDGGGALMAAAADGGIAALVSQRGAPVALAGYGGYLYWIDAQARTVLRVPRAGGAVEQIANTDDNPFALVVDASGVYWAAAGLTEPAGSVAHAPLVPGGPTTAMMTGVVGIQALAIDATQVYAAAVGGNVNGGGSIVAMDKSH